MRYLMLGALCALLLLGALLPDAAAFEGDPLHPTPTNTATPTYVIPWATGTMRPITLPLTPAPYPAPYTVTRPFYRVLPHVEPVRTLP